MGKISSEKWIRRTLVDYYKGMVNYVSSCRYMLGHYKWKREFTPVTSPLMVFKVDDYFYSGGMADRFKGAVTAYAYCKQRNLDFRIRYVFPFELSDYLYPAQYDWRLRENEYTECMRDAKVMYARAELGRRLVRQKIGRRQLHFYGNYDNLAYINRTGGTDYTWGGLFKELFRPCEAIEDAVAFKTQEIGAPYVSAVFRFQNLLGDFKEYKYSTIEDETEREELIEKCLHGLEIIKENHLGMPILVTSDSGVFVRRASRVSGVHVVGGDRVHIGSNSSDNADTYLNSFVDFYMLAGSQKIYSIQVGKMYPTNFPVYAAKLNDIPFDRIWL